MNPHTASIDEIRDFIAECKYPHLKACGDGRTMRHRGPYQDMVLHPIPETLDSAASCLPPQHSWDRISRRYDQDPVRPQIGPFFFTGYAAVVLYDPGDPCLAFQHYAEADGTDIESIKLAMFRAAALAWMRVFGDNVNKEKQE